MESLSVSTPPEFHPPLSPFLGHFSLDLAGCILSQGSYSIQQTAALIDRSSRLYATESLHRTIERKVRQTLSLLCTTLLQIDNKQYSSHIEAIHSISDTTYGIIRNRPVVQERSQRLNDIREKIKAILMTIGKKERKKLQKEMSYHDTSFLFDALFEEKRPSLLSENRDVRDLLSRGYIKDAFVEEARSLHKNMNF